MNINTDYKLRYLSDKTYVLESNNADKKVVVLNESAAFIWNAFAKGPVSKDDLLEKFTNHYHIDNTTGKSDLENTLNLWKSLSIINL